MFLQIDPVVQPLLIPVSVSAAESIRGRVQSLPGDFEGVKLHTHGKDRAVLIIVLLGVGTDQGAEVEVVDLLLVHGDELAPSLFALLTLHLVLVDGLAHIDLGKVLLEVLVDLVIVLGETELGTLDRLEDLPVRLHLLNGCPAG